MKFFDKGIDYKVHRDFFEESKISPDEPISDYFYIGTD